MGHLLGHVVHAGLEMAGGEDLFTVPDLDGDGAWSVTQRWVGAVVGPLQGGDDSAALYTDQGRTLKVHWKFVRHLQAQVVFARQRKCRCIYDFKQFVNYLTYRKFFNLQKLIWQDKGQTINCFSSGKTCVLPGLGS